MRASTGVLNKTTIDRFMSNVYILPSVKRQVVLTYLLPIATYGIGIWGLYFIRDDVSFAQKLKKDGWASEASKMLGRTIDGKIAQFARHAYGIQGGIGPRETTMREFSIRGTACNMAVQTWRIMEKVNGLERVSVLKKLIDNPEGPPGEEDDGGVSIWRTLDYYRSLLGNNHNEVPAWVEEH